ncbi:MAG: helix-turn-helix domain-containing protein [Anaerolineae bacterium]
MADDAIQEQLIAARRAQILEAAVKVFAAKGYHRATIPDIAREAGIAVGTIYNYFGKKDDLLLALLHHVNESDQRSDDLALAAEMDVREFARTYVRKRFELMTTEGLDVLRATLPEVLVNPELRTLYMEQIILPTFAIGEPHFQHLMDLGKIRKMDIRLTMRAIAATFLGLLMLRMLGDPVVEAQWDDIPDLLADMILNGYMPQ